MKAKGGFKMQDQELREAACELAESISRAFENHANDDQAFGRKVMDSIEYFILKVAAIHDVSPEEILRKAKSYDDDDDEEGGEFGFGGDWWKD